MMTEPVSFKVGKGRTVYHGNREAGPGENIQLPAEHAAALGDHAWKDEAKAPAAAVAPPAAAASLRADPAPSKDN